MIKKNFSNENEGKKIFISWLRTKSKIAIHILYDAKPDITNPITYIRPSDAFYFLRNGIGGYMEFKLFYKLSEVTIESFRRKLRPSQREALFNAIKHNIPYVGIACSKNEQVFTILNLSSKGTLIHSGTVENLNPSIVLLIMLPSKDS